MTKQLNLFGDEPKRAPKRNKKQVDKQLADFYKHNIKALTPYALVMTFDESAKPIISKDHQLDNFNESEMRIARMCEYWGMVRTFANEGLVASGGGKFLYRLEYREFSPIE